jgi:hypothetical protein
LGLLSLLIVSILTAVIDRSRTRHVPRVLLAMFGSVDLPHDAGPAHWILYIWIALLSIVLMVLYTSIMAQVLLLNTILDTFCKGKRRQCDHQRDDVGEQMYLSYSFFSLRGGEQPSDRGRGDALASLPVLVSWPVASAMKQLSCDNLDLRTVSFSAVSYPRSRPEVPAWFHGDIQDAVLTQVPKAVQSFILTIRSMTSPTGAWTTDHDAM